MCTTQLWALAAPLPRGVQDIREAFLELREYDVPYTTRFAIDTDTRVGHWYTVRVRVCDRVRVRVCIVVRPHVPATPAAWVFMGLHGSSLAVIAIGTVMHCVIHPLCAIRGVATGVGARGRDGPGTPARPAAARRAAHLRF